MSERRLIQTDEKTSEELDKKPVYIENGGFVIRASTLGSCPLRLAHIFNGRSEEHSPQLLEAFRMGHVFEGFIIAKLQVAHGLTFFRNQETVEYDCNGFLAPCIIRGHIDGMISPGSKAESISDILIHKSEPIPFNTLDGMVAEFKSASDSSFKEFCSKGIADYPGYQKQFATYIQVLSHTGGVIFFINKKTQEIAAQYISPLTASLQMEKIREQANKTIEAIVNLKSSKPQKCSDFRGLKFSCPFADLHEDEEEEEVENSELFKAFEKRDRLKKEIGDLEEQVADLQRIIDGFRDKTENGKIRCGDYHSYMNPGKKSTDYIKIRTLLPQLKQMEDEYKKMGKPYPVYSKVSGKNTENDRPPE